MCKFAHVGKFLSRERGYMTSLSGLCHSECKLILYFVTVHVYCVYPAISKSQKLLTNCLKRTETSLVLIGFMLWINTLCFTDVVLCYGLIFYASLMLFYAMD